MPSTYIVEAGVLDSMLNIIKKSPQLIKSIWTNDDSYRMAKSKRQANSWQRSTSIARLSKDLIMSFPTVCSNVIDPKTASMINKAIERKNVTMIQMVAAAVHLQGFSGKDVVAQLHTNMGVNYNVDDYIDQLLLYRDMANESAETTAVDGTPYVVIGAALKEAFLESLKEVYPTENFSENSILAFNIVDKNHVILLSEANKNSSIDADERRKQTAFENNQRRRDELHQQRMNLNYQAFQNKEARDQATYDARETRSERELYEKIRSNDIAWQRNEIDAQKGINDLLQKNRDFTQRAAQYAQDRSDKISQQNREFDQKERHHADDLEHRRQQLNYQRQKDYLDQLHTAERDRVQDQKDARMFAQQQAQGRSQYLQRQLLDTDVKKANELQPTLITLQYQVADPNADPSQVRNNIAEEFVAGVKSRLIAVPSEEIVDRIIDMRRSGVDMRNLIRATTKETSFTRDFLGAVEAAKIDARRNSKLSRTNPIWRSLQARSNKSTLKRLTRVANTAAAITTLVISKQEVEMVKNGYDIDLSNPAVAVEFMNAYNLMGLVIVDEQTEVASFIYDGDAYFEDMSFAVLEKENNNVSTRQIVNLLNSRR